MKKIVLLLGLLPCLLTYGQGYKVYKSDGKVDAYPGETAVSVTLNDDSLRYAGYEYVDLGLPSGIRWATENVDGHFAFDKAHGQWGGDWRVPSTAEYQELIAQCRWTWSRQGNMQGYLLTGPNGNQLYLPADGFIESDGSFAGGLTGRLGAYWTDEGTCFAISADGKGISANGQNLLLSLRHVIGGTPMTDPRTDVLKDSSHDYVDLGLSVLWATTNIGAATPEDFGCYFGDGMTEPFPDNLMGGYNYNATEAWYSSHSPMFVDGQPIQDYMHYYFLNQDREEKYETWAIQSRQYYMYGSNGKEGGYWLLPEHDAATVLWGDGWRLPTLSEYQELISNCQYNNGSYIGPNGATLYLPGAGCVEKDGRLQQSGRVYYRTASNEGISSCWVFNGRSAEDNFYNRYCPIRPVKDRPVKNLTDEATLAQVEMVDLGLSVKWASCNWGAVAPEAKGEYAAMGETFPKAQYTLANYHPAGYTVQTTKAMFGRGGWTLPTAADVQELIEKCTWVREAGGYRVTGPSGKSIFMPYTGYREGQSLNFSDEAGFYRTADGQQLRLTDDGEPTLMAATDYVGLAVRPVTAPGYPMATLTAVDWRSASFATTDADWIELSFIDKMDSNRPWQVDADENGLATVSLQPNATYYYRVCGTNEDGRKVTGEIHQLQTAGEIPAVDLGLSVKWAAVNYGTTGEYDVDGWYTSEDGMSDKLPPVGTGIYDGRLMAPTFWGDEWRMPTEAELQELLDKCTWQWQQDDEWDIRSGENRNGYRVTGPNGNSIFLPANGEADNNLSPNGAGVSGYYWSTTADEKYQGTNKILKLTSDSRKISFAPKSGHYSIRPVKK